MSGGATRDPALRRAGWLKTLHRWHWISSAVSLVGMLLFAFTGITLNHASQIPAHPQVVRGEATVPAPLREALKGVDDGALPASLVQWVEATWPLRVAGRAAEWSDEEVYVPLPRPGGDAWLRIDRGSGQAEYELTDRGWISYLNDLHKGRHSGVVWSGFIDLFAVACLVFSITGLWILKLHAPQRPLVWPITALGLVLPVLLALLFVVH